MKEFGGFLLLGGGFGLLNGNIIRSVWWVDIISFAIIAIGLRLVVVGIIEEEVVNKEG